MDTDKSLQVFVEMRPSERLSYRLMNKDDFLLFFQINSDDRVMMYAYNDGYVSEEEAMSAFEQILEDQKNDEKGSQFVVIEKETMLPIGIVDYYIEHLHHSGGIYELGYFILPAFWGKGYATEMGKSMIDYLFENYNIHKISASCHIDNRRSESTMKKLMMTKEGIIRNSRYKERRWVDEVKYGILREEWCCEEE